MVQGVAEAHATCQLMLATLTRKKRKIQNKTPHKSVHKTDTFSTTDIRHFTY